MWRCLHGSAYKFYALIAGRTVATVCGRKMKSVFFYIQHRTFNVIRSQRDDVLMLSYTVYTVVPVSRNKLTYFIFGRARKSPSSHHTHHTHTLTLTHWHLFHFILWVCLYASLKFRIMRGRVSRVKSQLTTTNSTCRWRGEQPAQKETHSIWNCHD